MNSTIESYAKAASRGVLFGSTRRKARDELVTHVLERVEELKSEGLSEDQAVTRAILEMGDARMVSKQFAKSYRPALIRRILLGFVGALVLLAGLSVTLQIRSSFSRADVIKQSAKQFQQDVIKDLEIVRAESFFNSSPGERDAGPYLNEMLAGDIELSKLRLDHAKLMEYDHWDFTRSGPGKAFLKSHEIINPFDLPAPNMMTFFEYLTAFLESPGAEKDPLFSLRFVRHTARLLYSSEMIISSAIAVALLEQERKTYQAWVSAGKLRNSEWTPLDEATLEAAARAFRALPAYYYLGYSENRMPDPERWCGAINEAAAMASFTRPLLEGQFPLEGSYQHKFAEFSRILEASRPFCRLDVAHRVWRQANDGIVLNTRSVIGSGSFSGRLIPFMLKYAHAVPYLRRALEPTFAGIVGMSWIKKYENRNTR
ncbi:MAG: hypothetical protein A2X94_10395 [Bdellovibrionales bacterium GWB1_55_8]|nr:MAG: hypothetical protein A2X94_10395 [Bdellovibrionales bacterium GWB1_55_8]